MKLFEERASTQKPLRDPRLTAINFVADAVNRTLDLKEIADNALHAILAVMKLDAAAVYLWHERDGELHLFAWRGISEAFARQVARVRRGDDGTVDEVLEGATKVIEDFALASQAFREDAVRAGFRSAVLMPIRAQGTVVGLLALGSYQVREVGEADIDLLEVISNQIGDALMHAQLQAELRASEEQYRALVENSNDAIYIAGLDGRPRFANSAFSRIFGYEAQELAQMDPIERVHPDDVPAVREAYAQLARGELVHNLECRFCRKDGQWIDLQGSASVFSRDGETASEFQFVMREVTEARQRQQQLVRRNRQLAALTMLAEVANSSLNIEQIARNTLEVALETTGMEGGAIHLADPERTRLELFLQIGLPDELVEQLRSLPWGEGVSGMVATTGETKVFRDLATEAPMARPAAIKHGYKTLIVVPVRAKGEMMGTLGLISHSDIDFTPEAVEMITAMGNQLGIALANARLYAAQVRENEKLNAMVDISSESTQRLDLTKFLRRILQRSEQLLKADAAYMIRYEPKTDMAEVVTATAGFGQLVGKRFPAVQGLFGQIRAAGQGKIFSHDEVVRHTFSVIVRDAGVRSALVVPLISRGELIGCLGLFRLAAAHSDFNPTDLELMEAFASRAAAAIDNAQLLGDLRHKNELLALLIEEAHHRIKNNLQMISGLLLLEADGTKGSLEGHLRTAIARIQAIAQVHNLLSSEMPEKVDAHTLITTIVHTLTDSVPLGDGPPQLELKLEHLWLGSDQAVALALIVNELVANSVRHGHAPAGQRLRVGIEFRQDGEEALLLVSDNGGGFREGKDWRQLGGQGMNIVQQLAAVNLRGSLQIGTREGGVQAELRFVVLPEATPPPPKSLAAAVGGKA